MSRSTAFVVALCLSGAPAVAQNDGTGNGMGEGLDLMERGARQLLEGLMEELEPRLKDLRERIGDLNAYEAPEILPNGDIIIRRKKPLDPELEDLPVPEGEGIEL